VNLTERRPSVVLVGWVGAAATVVLAVASRVDVVVVAAATPFLCFFVLATLLSSPTHRADAERRRATVRATRRLAALLDECSGLRDLEAVTDRVAEGLVELLDLQACWFEPGAGAGDLPVLDADGDVTARVQHRVGAGLVLPPLVAVPVPGPHGPIGRFVLEASATVGLSPERRLLAFAASRVVPIVRSGGGASERAPSSGITGSA
jgi:hypothetical protein